MSLLSKEKVLYEDQGLYSSVKVTLKGTQVKIYTGNNFLQSCYDSKKIPSGSVFDWYLAAPWFLGNFNRYLESLLILGLGGGSQVKLYNRAYEVKSIIGVEIDPLIIDIGQKYFSLNDPNLQIINTDAAAYLRQPPGRFEVILLDTFKENQFESALTSRKLLTSIEEHLTPNGVLLINRVGKDTSNQKLEVDLVKIFKTVFSLKVWNNIFYLGTNSPTAPKTEAAALKILRTAAESNEYLNFFKLGKDSALSRC